MWNRVEFFCEILLGFFLFFFELDFRESQKCVKKEGAAVHVFFNGCPPLLFPVIITDQGQVINMGIKQR